MFLITLRKFDFPSFIVGKMFPQKLQPFYFANHALYLQAYRSRNASSQISICQNRLLFWEETLKSLQDPSIVPHEPIARVLKQQLRVTRINPKLLERLVNYQLFDIERGEINTMKELDVYGQNTRSLLLYLNLQLLQVESDEAFKAASHVGRAIAITDVIKRTKLDLIKHRTYMPTSILSKYNLNFLRIWDSRTEGQLSEDFYDVLLEVAGYAKKHLELAREFKIDKRAARAFLLSVQTDFFLDRLEQYNFDIMDSQVHKTSTFRVPFRVWKKARAGSF